MGNKFFKRMKIGCGRKNCKNNELRWLASDMNFKTTTHFGYPIAHGIDRSNFKTFRYLLGKGKRNKVALQFTPMPPEILQLLCQNKQPALSPAVPGPQAAGRFRGQRGNEVVFIHRRSFKKGRKTFAGKHAIMMLISHWIMAHPFKRQA